MYADDPEQGVEAGKLLIGQRWDFDENDEHHFLDTKTVSALIKTVQDLFGVEGLSGIFLGTRMP